MRLTSILLMLAVIQVTAATSEAQKISFQKKDATLLEVLQSIGQQTGYFYVCDAELLRNASKVNITVKKAGIHEVLAAVFKDQPLTYAIHDKTIVVKEKARRTPVPKEESLVREPNHSPSLPVMNALRTGKLLERISLSKTVDRTIRGRVTDKKGEGLPGVNIILKGTRQGTVSNPEGQYEISVPDDNATLIFSFVGYVSEEIVVGSRTSIEISLKTDEKALEEVVVVGYGTTKRSDLTGAVSSVNVAQLSEIPNVSIAQAFQGNVAGLNVGAISEAGASPEISIRGQNTLSGNSGDNSPLIVVDGIIYRGNLVDLNVSDIASVDVLKDASSTAIYGSQASNGVIIVTTKRGEEGRKPTINFTSSYTLQRPSSKLEPMEGKELESFLKDVFWESGSRVAPEYLTENPNFSIVPFLRNAQIGENYQAGIENKWWDLLTGNGSINNQNLSVSGGTDKVNYFLSAGLSDVKGFMVNENFKKYNFRINLDTKVNKWLGLGTETFISTSDYSGVSPNISNTFVMYPWAPIYDEDGVYTLNPDSRGLNPFLEIQQDDSDKRLNIMSTFHSDIRLPFLKGFNYRVNYSHNYRTTNQDRFNPWGANYTGLGYKNTDINYNWTFDNIFTYQKNFLRKNSISFTYLYGVEEVNSSFTNTSAQNFVNKTLGFNRLQAGSPAQNSVSSGKERENSLYSMGRLVYNHAGKYLLTGTVRRDGFSGFGSKKKIGVFPSLALGWIVSEEAFFKHFEQVDFLKLRASYGISGRRAVGRYATQAVVSSKPSGVFGEGGVAEMGQWISSLANDQLGWESTRGVNFGLDFGIHNSKFSGSIEFYKNVTKDILYNVQLPSLTGFSQIATNVGKVKNWGLEFTLNGNLITTENFRWRSTAAFSLVRNKIVSILGPQNDQDNDGKEDDLVANLLFIGEPQNVNYNYQIEGIWQLSDKAEGKIPAGFLPGSYKLADLNGDGNISASNDRKILGYQDPSYRLSWSNTLVYGNFNLYLLINTIQGGKNYYQSNLSFGTNPWHKLDQLIYSTPPKGSWDYWMPENPDAKFRRPDNPTALDINAGPHAQRNFIRLQDISLAYNFNKNFLNKIGVSNLKLFLSGKNLLTITKWMGWDPETGVGFTPGRPVMSNYSIGLNFTI